MKKQGKLKTVETILSDKLLEALMEVHAAKAMAKFKRVHQDLRQLSRAHEREVEAFTKEMRSLLHGAHDQSKQWRKIMDEYLLAAKAMDRRYQKMGEKGSHADIIRQTIQKNIRHRDFAAAEHNIDALIRLYDFDDQPHPQGKQRP